jgi:hypothetical protein
MLAFETEVLSILYWATARRERTQLEECVREPLQRRRELGEIYLSSMGGVRFCSYALGAVYSSKKFQQSLYAILFRAY